MDRFFGENSSDSDEDEFVGLKESLAKRNRDSKDKKSKKTRRQIDEALKEDKSIFEFDKFLDDPKTKEKKRDSAKSEPGQSKYISQMLDKAEERKRDYKVLVEKRIQKEIEKEKEKMGKVQVFVTGAYKEKLKEQEKWKEERSKDPSVGEMKEGVFVEDIPVKNHQVSPPPMESRERDSNIQEQNEIEEDPTILKKRKINEISGPSNDKVRVVEKVSKVDNSDSLSLARERYRKRLEERRKREQEAKK